MSRLSARIVTSPPATTPPLTAIDSKPSMLSAPGSLSGPVKLSEFPAIPALVTVASGTAASKLPRVTVLAAVPRLMTTEFTPAAGPVAVAPPPEVVYPAAIAPGPSVIGSSGSLNE